MSTALLQFKNINLVFRSIYQEVHALKDVTFSLAPGEFLSVLGPSGSGKSTILRLAAGLEEPTSGEVLFDSHPMDGPDRRRGFVFQSYNVFPWLTVRKNIAFGLNDSESDENKEKITNWLDFTGLTEFADSYPKALSGGMRQRLALARTMIVEPELLLLDEPFGALDERTKEGMKDLLLQAVSRTGCSVIFVTHDIQDAICLADRVILLGKRPGSIIDIFPISSSKPRSREFLRSEEFAQLHGTLLDRFPV